MEGNELFYKNMLFQLQLCLIYGSIIFRNYCELLRQEGLRLFVSSYYIHLSMNPCLNTNINITLHLDVETIPYQSRLQLCLHFRKLKQYLLSFYLKLMLQDLQWYASHKILNFWNNSLAAPKNRCFLLFCQLLPQYLSQVVNLISYIYYLFILIYFHFFIM